MAGGSRASVDLAVLMLFCAACSVASADNISTFALQEDLFRYACTLDSNLTLEGEVSSRIRARHNNGVVTGRIRGIKITHIRFLYFAESNIVWVL